MERREVLRLGVAGVLAAFVPVERRFASVPQLLDVRSYGALGDGRQDDTHAFQAAVGALPASGGTVHVPDGRYLIDPVRGVTLRSGLHLDLTDDAVLAGMQSGGRRSALLFGVSSSDLVITGGRFLGSEDGTTPSPGIAAAFGIDLRGCTRVRIERVRMSGFGRDGIYIGAARDGGWRPCGDVTLNACVLEHCRRQGVSVTSCTGFHMTGCEAADIGPDLPGSGVDLEPNPDRKVVGAEIRACSFRDSTGFGIMVGGDGGDEIVIADNEISACARGGILVKASRNALVSGNRISGSEPAISVRGRTSGVRLEQNECTAGGIEVVRPATAERVGNRC